MASDRIGLKSANLVAVPPFEVRAVTTDFILQQPTVKQNIRNVPVNERLVFLMNLKENGEQLWNYEDEDGFSAVVNLSPIGDSIFY